MLLDQLFTQDALDLTETSDYARRREREEAIISGQKPARRRQPAQTSDYARRREQEKKQEQGVAEAKPVAHTIDHAVWSKKSPDDQRFLKQLHPKLKIKNVPPPPRAEKPPKVKPDLWKIAVKAENVLGNIFPDGDPVDYMYPYLKSLGIPVEKQFDVLNKAIKLHVDKKGYYHWLEATWDGVAKDRQMPDIVRLDNNPWRTEESVAEGFNDDDTVFLTPQTGSLANLRYKTFRDASPQEHKKAIDYHLKGADRATPRRAAFHDMRARMHQDWLSGKPGVAEGKLGNAAALAAAIGLGGALGYGHATKGTPIMKSKYQRSQDLGNAIKDRVKPSQEKAKTNEEQGVAEMDSQGYKGHRGDEDPGKGPEKVVKAAQPEDVKKSAAKQLEKAMHKAYKKGVAEGDRFDEPLTGYHIVYRKSGQVVHATPSFETQDAAQKYLMTRMFANHQDYRVAHTAQLGLAENLRKWFREKWVRFNPQGKIMGACARGDDSEGKPKCLPQAKAHALGKAGRASAAARKRREDPNPERRGAAKNVATKEAQLAEKQDACYRKVKSRYKVWPSAYASGALVQCRKRGAANWGNKS